MKQIKVLTTETEVQEKIRGGLAKAYALEKAGYGPMAGNVMLEQPYGDPEISRDGITNIRRFFAEDPIENMAIRSVFQASYQSNKSVGDGTTASVLLSVLLYEEARKQMAAGKNRMEVSRRLKEVSYGVLTQLQTMAKPFDDKLLPKVAEISAGSSEIGKMLSDLFQQLGLNGQIIVEATGEEGILSDVINGFWFPKGFAHLNLTNDPSNLISKHFDVPILLSERPMKTTTDLAPLLARIAPKFHEIILIAEIGNEVADLLMLNHVKGVIDVIPVEPYGFEGKRSLFLDDLACVIGAKVYRSVPEDFRLEDLGYADKVLIEGKSTTIVIDQNNEDNDEQVDARLNRIAELRQQLESTDDIIDSDSLMERITRLEGRMGFIKVGAPTELERNELKLRIDDAISAIKSAPKHGVLPGGGVALARVDAKEFNDAYQKLIILQAENAGLNPYAVLDMVNRTQEWRGVNFKTADKDNLKLIDMYREGIIDPCLVIEEVVKNATSIASALITVTAATHFLNREDKLE